MVKNNYQHLLIEANTPRIHLACYDAVRGWHDDIVKHQEFTNSSLKCQTQFTEFLKDWQLSRSVKLANRGNALLALIDLRNGIEASNHLIHDWPQVDEAAIKMQANPDGKGRCTSLASKFAFCHSPKHFSPYDSFALRALRSLGAEIKDHAYVDFMNAFEEIHFIISGLFTENDTPWRKYLTNLGAELSGVESDLFSRRVTDKFLMLMGGYGDIKVHQKVCEGMTETQRSGIYTTISGKL